MIEIPKKKKTKTKNNKKERLRGLNENSLKLKSIIYSLTLLLLEWCYF